MTNANQNHENFQRLLRELFQFDCADLDFGVYRIMNHKREVIEKFISEDLVKAVSEVLDRGALHDQELAVNELQETAQLIKETLGNKALDADGKLQESFHDIPIGKKYEKLRKRAYGARSREALKTDIFNHLFAFFSRYYQDGDFISKRRYSKQQRYAIPYNGEEVYLHWANSDQYYIKTAEHFHDYSFTTAHGATVYFKLRTADVEQNNVKGAQRFFLPRIEEITSDEKTGELVIPFEYRPLNDEEEIRYGRSNQQDAIIAEFVMEIPAQWGQPNEILLSLTAERYRNADNEPVTFLEHHLRQYTRRNTSDFFIHKNLKEFLSRELDFYIKSEVLNLDDMEVAGEDFAEGWFQVVRVIRTMGGHIIDFLAQLEGFQKMLWEKRKFITGTQYCITIGNIDERFYSAIADCEPQWAEWKDLFHINEDKTDLFNSNGNKRLIFMKDNPTLALDTIHFDEAFKDELLASIEDIDEQCDGLLLHSENFQALGFLQEIYREKVKCIYIDPPYNTSASAILYKNDYKDSSWLSLMENRLSLSSNLLSRDGLLCCAIDDEEMARVRLVMQSMFEKELGIVSVRSNPAGRKSSGQFSPAHEYALFFGNADATPGTLPKTERELARFPLQDTRGRFAWANLIRSGSNDRREDRPKMFYPIYITKNNTLRIPEMEWDKNEREYKILEQPGEDETAVWPIKMQNGISVEKNWHRGWELVKSDLSEYRIRRDEGDGANIDFKTRMDTDSMPKTWWDDKKYASANLGAKALKGLFGNKDFDFAKAIDLVGDCLRASLCESCSVVLDYFAGSGTTGHAVINLNREDDGNRKFILVEMGQYFDTVLLPRIKKIIFTPEWKDGKPKRMATREEAERSPRIIKYLCLESYEDALDNIGFDDSSGQQAMKFEDYLLKYMLAWETRESATLLNVEKLARPFDYKLHIHTNDGTRKKIVDIPETFNYLLGLHVQTRRIYDDGGRRYLIYRGLVDQRQTVILWRETEGWQKAELERDQQFVAAQKLTEDADEVFVNGDSFIPNAKSLDPVFKARMFAAMQA